MRFAIFLTILVLLLAGANALLYRRTVREFSLSPRPRRVLAVVLAAGLVAMVAGRAMASRWPHPATSAIAGFGLVVELGVLITTILMLVERSAAGIAKVAQRVWTRLSPSRAATEPAAPEAHPAGADDAATDAVPSAGSGLARVVGRRELMSRTAAGAALVIGGSSAGYGGLFGRHDYVIEEVPVRLERLPRELDGFTIAQLSDIHFGLFVDDRELRHAVELVGRARPDLVVLTGDLVDNDPRFADHLGRLARALGEIAPVAAVPGNHDYYAGIGATMGQLRAAGASVLVNRGQLVAGGIALVGVDDLWARRYGPNHGPDLKRAVAALPEDAPRVVLCHQPAFFRQADERIDLMLSGHTHGGQVNLGIRPADFVLPYGYVAGLYRHGDAQLYVNRGFGTAGPPARVGAAPEVSKIILTA